MPPPARTEEEITTILMALVAWAGQITATCRYLKSEKGITISPLTLTDWKVRYGDRYDSLREQHQGELETNLANELRDVARLAVEVERLAVEKARARLNAGKDQDPGRTAANLARVAQSSTDKLMTLTARPQTYSDNRDPMEIMRSLVNLGVLKAPDEPVQIEQVTGE